MVKLYTIGIYFSCDLKKILLIHNKRPDWQNGKYNFPGGKVELYEDKYDCIIREFKEETNIETIESDWKHIGNIYNNEIGYCVDILVCVQNKEQEIRTMTDEEVFWHDIDKLPDNCITNVYWLVLYAINTIRQGNVDNLMFGSFKYE